MDDDSDPTKRAMPRPKPYATPRVGSAMIERNSTGRRLIVSLVFSLALAGVVVLGSAYYFGVPAFSPTCCSATAADHPRVVPRR